MVAADRKFIPTWSLIKWYAMSLIGLESLLFGTKLSITETGMRITGDNLNLDPRGPVPLSFEKKPRSGPETEDNPKGIP